MFVSWHHLYDWSDLIVRLPPLIRLYHSIYYISLSYYPCPQIPLLSQWLLVPCITERAAVTYILFEMFDKFKSVRCWIVMMDVTQRISTCKGKILWLSCLSKTSTEIYLNWTRLVFLWDHYRHHRTSFHLSQPVDLCSRSTACKETLLVVTFTLRRIHACTLVLQIHTVSDLKANASVELVLREGLIRAEQHVTLG